MKRRTFIRRVAGGLLAVPLSATAQQAGKVPVVGVLNIAVGPRSFTVDTTRQGLRDLGDVEGQTIVFELRFAGGRAEAQPAFAADLVGRKVDVLLVSGPAAVRAARDATSTIPFVALDLESDPVRAGFVRSFAQPGGNMTGLASQFEERITKQLQLLKEAVRPLRLTPIKPALASTETSFRSTARCASRPPTAPDASGCCATRARPPFALDRLRELAPEHLVHDHPKPGPGAGGALLLTPNATARSPRRPGAAPAAPPPPHLRCAGA